MTMQDPSREDWPTEPLIDPVPEEHERQPRPDEVRPDEPLGAPDDPLQDDPSRVQGDPAEDDM